MEAKSVGLKLARKSYRFVKSVRIVLETGIARFGGRFKYRAGRAKSATRALSEQLGAARRKGPPGMREFAKNFIWADFIASTYGLEGAALESAADEILSTKWNVYFDPNPYFDSDFYLETYHEEVVESRLSPLMHYLFIGSLRGYEPSPLFGSELVATHTLKDEILSRSDFPEVFKHLFIGAEVDLDQVDGRDFALATSPAEFESVAILVPVFNNWLWTERCLRALASCPEVNLSNVFVVDDCSTDQTREHVARWFPEVQLVSNRENLGFLQSCNKAFDEVRHEYSSVLVLNNDTEPLPGFLSELLRTQELFEDAALTGARLLYPDGKVQELGGIIWKDASGWNYGRGKSADPSLLPARRVDYVSGACLLIKTSKISGPLFDPQFSPAYYEDTDLAFRMRAQGYQTVLAPYAMVIHHEGKTHGTDIRRGLKRYQEINATKFLQKWKERLTEHFDPDPLRVRAASLRIEVRAAKGVLLWVDYQLPDPSRDSGSVRAMRIAKMLRSLGMLVIFIPQNEDTKRITPRPLLSEGVIVERTLSDAKRLLDALVLEPSHILLSRVTTAAEYYPLVESAFPDARIIFDTVDLHFLRLERQENNGPRKPLFGLAKTIKSLEFDLIQKCTATLVVSSYEKELIESALPNARVELVSNIHDFTRASGYSGYRDGMVFIGSFLHPPNEEGLRWFFAEVWPRLGTDTRSRGIKIIGQNPPDWLAGLDDQNVEVLGWVRDADPIIASSAVSVAPLLSGAGVKGKVGHSMQMGTPVVGTSIAFEGMQLIHGVSCFVADEPSQFANYLELLTSDQNLASEIARQAIGVGEEFFSEKAALVGLRRALGIESE